MMEALTTMSPFMVAIIFIACMFSVALFAWQTTGSLECGILLAQSINCFNLAIYSTAWLQLGVKPFIPLWLSLLLLGVPLIGYIAYTTFKARRTNNG